jgi:hypothetical protein
MTSIGEAYQTGLRGHGTLIFNERCITHLQFAPRKQTASRLFQCTRAVAKFLDKYCVLCMSINLLRTLAIGIRILLNFKFQ